MMFAADPPAVIAAAPITSPADMVVVSLDTHSDMVVSADTPLPLIKAGKTEDAVFRQTLFLTRTLTVVRPATGIEVETLRWTYQPYLQRQLCFTSITGQFSCADAVFEELTEKANGETLLPLASDQVASDQATPPPNPAAEAARLAITTALRTEATALFDDDRRLKLTPMLKAAGVSIRRPPVAASSVRR